MPIESRVINPRVVKGWVSHDTVLGTNSYDLNDAYSPDTTHRQSCVLDLASPKFEPNKTYIFDKSGKNNHGTITGATWVREKSGVPVLSFDGTDDKITLSDGVGSALNFTTQNFTIQTWINLTNLPTDDASSNVVIVKGEYNVSGYSLTSPYSDGVHLYTRLITSQLGATQTIYSNDMTGKISANKSYLFTFVRIGNTAEVYINDTALGIVAGAGTLINPATTNDATILGIWGASYPMDGKMGLIKIFNRELSASQIAGIYQSERHLFGV
jgi:hypothetical protein